MSKSIEEIVSKHVHAYKLYHDSEDLIQELQSREDRVVEGAFRGFADFYDNQWVVAKTVREMLETYLQERKKG